MPCAVFKKQRFKNANIFGAHHLDITIGYTVFKPDIQIV